MIDFGILKYFLGIEVVCGPDGTSLSHMKDLLDIISKCGFSGARP